MQSAEITALPVVARWQPIHQPLLLQRQVELWVYQLNTAIPQLSGNKWLKLKYHIAQAQQAQKAGFLTFGGAFSNHLAAVAAMCRYHGLKSLAYVRADQLDNHNPTLAFCLQQGMQIQLLSREQYRLRNDAGFLQQLQQQHQHFLIVPEGGSSVAGASGVAELELDLTPNGKASHIICAAASGGTLAGIINGAGCKVLGIAVVKDPSLPARISQLLHSSNNQQNWSLNTDFCGAGYARFDDSVLQFCREMAQQQLYLEPIYTGKALAGVFALIKQGYFPPGSRLSFFHTGGLQGLAGLHYRKLITNADFALLSGLAAD
ncbi:1-aminocyclopropane-1-carboxylate deaminase [Rheinheimera pacifica]|uniref:1-aminocyclopropane-1-carboxylate deaminase/D-cysteine desulfhydrase n=1 Tax=Rheinheimera pacifica TaxID=173990 RepID=UPI00285F9109|nr:pyridoxal-phosphate dependent enzyme [Rheinheimera pacifica]MDR6984208.1 1-aminocyclopropane-1-carboxylate deaminase [Rheinheimera pacifica]